MVRVGQQLEAQLAEALARRPCSRPARWRGPALLEAPRSAPAPLAPRVARRCGGSARCGDKTTGLLHPEAARAAGKVEGRTVAVSGRGLRFVGASASEIASGDTPGGAGEALLRARVGVVERPSRSIIRARSPASEVTQSAISSTPRPRELSPELRRAGAGRRSTSRRARPRPAVPPGVALRPPRAAARWAIVLTVGGSSPRPLRLRVGGRARRFDRPKNPAAGDDGRHHPGSS